MIDIYKALKEYNVNVLVYDPWADFSVVKREYNIDIISELDKEKVDAVILAVAHEKFRDFNLIM